MENNGYIELYGAIIRQAIDDLDLLDSVQSLDTKDKYQLDRIRDAKDAYHFLTTKRLDRFCKALGLDVDYIRAHIDFTKYEKKMELLTKAVCKIA